MKHKQTYIIELVTKEPYIDRSTELQTIIEDSPIMKDTEVNVDLQREDKV